MHILSIETSCDETAASVIRGEKNRVIVLSNVVSSQVKLHAEWGGVVPNLAAREHLRNIAPVFRLALKESGIPMAEIDLVAVTNGPGLIPALLIGVNFAKALAYRFKKPLLGVHHIEGHIYANFVGASSNSKVKSSKQKEVQFPVLALVVSGGHTQLVLMKDHLKYEIIGETLDDAAGEAFDKVARILNLGYPGGPAISAMADKFKKLNASSKADDPKATNYKLSLPRPMLNKKNFDFSFSGLKTAVLYEAKRNPGLLKDGNYVRALSAEFQQAVVDVLVGKTLAAAREYEPKTILLAGGVSANQELRRQLGARIGEELPNVAYALPDIAYSVDNAAMIASAAYFRHKGMRLAQRRKLITGWKSVQADAGLELA